MALFKRFEFWIALTFFVVIALWAVLSSRCSSGLVKGDPSPIETPKAQKRASEKAKPSIATPAPEKTSPTESSAAPTSGSSQEDVSLRDLTLIRDYGNAQLRITLEVHNASEQAFALQAPGVVLKAAGDVVVPPFFLPFQEVPVLDPGERRTVTLPYWLDPVHFEGGLDLHVGDDVFPIKSPTPFDLEAVENDVETKVKSPDWTL